MTATTTTGLARLLLGLFFDKSHFPPTAGGLTALIPWIKGMWFQKVLRFNGRARWPMNPTCRISDRTRIHFPKGEVHNFQSPGTYFQNFGADIYIGTGVYIAANVGIITANHDPANVSTHLVGADVTIGDHCWIGMNCVILPGVTLGSGTVVGAGSVVTKSFTEGHCVIGGTPARIIRNLDPLKDRQPSE